MRDPAFNFYSDNFLSGTMFFSDEQVGKYIRLLCAQHQTGHLSEKQMLYICKTYDEDIWKKFTKDENGLFYNDRLQVEIEKRNKYCESRRLSRLKSDEDNVKIYLIKDNDTGYFKIGSSVNPLRRFAEMCNQKNPAITVGERNYTLFWVSDIYPRSIETDIHNYFKDKNITGEWFNLDSDDIDYISNNYSGKLLTSVKRTLVRTSQRTGIGIGIGIGNKTTKGKVLDFSFVEPDFSKAFTEWVDYKRSKGQTYKNQKSLEACYFNLIKLSGKDPPFAREIVFHSIANNYAGLYKPKNSEANDTKQYILNRLAGTV